MHTVEMMVMSGVLRSADNKSPRPSVLFRQRAKPRDSREEIEPEVSVTGRYLAERVAQLFSIKTARGIWTLHR